MKNNTFLEIGKRLLSAETILLFPHMRVDGDALGSSAALCAALRKLGKKAWILMEDEIPENLRFLAGTLCTWDCGIAGIPDVCAVIDCSDVGRFKRRRDVFFSGTCRICIDHHTTAEALGDLNYIDSSAAATGEIVYDLLSVMEVRPDAEIANALYAAIDTDTGSFRYSNTTKKTHEIASALFDYDLDSCYVCNEIYDNTRREQLVLHAAALSGMKVFAGGRSCIASVNRRMLAETGADSSETDGIVEKLRGIRGIEVAALLKEEGDQTVKVSLRSKNYLDVAAITGRFGGGGHKRAAGCTIRKPLAEAETEIRKAIEDEIKEETECQRKES